MSAEPPDFADSIQSVEHYTGGDGCHYECASPAEFVVRARVNGDGLYTFVGCRDCLNEARIYPIDNDHVDAFEGGVDLR